MKDELFGEVISSYSTADAVEDGVLVPITKHDLVTRTVWEWLVEHTPMDSQPPCWPVEMMGWFRAGSVTQKEALKYIAKYGKEAQEKYERQVRDNKALALAKGLIGSNARQAMQAEERGDTLMLYAQLRDVGAYVQKHIIASLGDKYTPNCQTMYLRPNEVGGVTLMFPEDD